MTPMTRISPGPRFGRERGRAGLLDTKSNGIINAMVTTMDSAGRVVLPKAARERADLKPGVAIEVRVIDGRIELEPAAARVTVGKHGGFWVATPVEGVPALAHDEVETTIDAVRLRSVPTNRSAD